MSAAAAAAAEASLLAAATETAAALATFGGSAFHQQHHYQHLQRASGSTLAGGRLYRPLSSVSIASEDNVGLAASWLYCVWPPRARPKVT